MKKAENDIKKELPNDWKMKSLGTIASLITKGSTPTTYGYSYQESGVNFIKIENIKDGKINIPSIEFFISDEAHNSQQRSKLKEGDLLFSIAGTIGSVAKVFKEDLPANTNQALAIIRGYENELYSDFLSYYLKSNLTKTLINKARGGALQNISLTDIKESSIIYPPLPEQQRIVEKLDALFLKIDKAIGLTKENLEHSKHLLPSALNEVFKDGEIKTLNEIATVARGKSKHRPRNDEKLFGGQYPFIQTGDVRKATKYITEFEQKYSDIGLAQSKIWPKGTICLTIAANIGDVAILGIDACFPDSVVGILTNKKCISEYLYYYLQTLQSELDKKANAAAQKNINLNILEQVEVPLPNLSTQQKIVNYLNKLSNKQKQLVAHYSKQLKQLEGLKASLLDGAFRGEI